MLYRAQNTVKAYELFQEVLANHTRPAAAAATAGKNRRRGGGAKRAAESPWTDSAIETTKGKLIYSRGEPGEYPVFSGFFFSVLLPNVGPKKKNNFWLSSYSSSTRKLHMLRPLAPLQ